MPPADDYERAEAAYLDALRTGAGSDLLAAAAKAVSDSAGKWAQVAYRQFFAMRESLGGDARGVIEQEIVAEKAEMLQELWGDIASAHAAT